VDEGPRRLNEPRAEAASRVYTLKLSPREMTQLRAAARANHQRPSEFARDAIVGAVLETIDPIPD
jgi:uncharacterized membrane protein